MHLVEADFGRDVPKGYDIQFHGERYMPTNEEREALSEGDVIEGFIAATYTWFDKLESGSDAEREEARGYFAERILGDLPDGEARPCSSLEMERLDIFVPFGDDVCARYRITI